MYVHACETVYAPLTRTPPRPRPTCRPVQAFQLSLGAALEHPTTRMVREQMLARLMAVVHTDPQLQEWFDSQVRGGGARGGLQVPCLPM